MTKPTILIATLMTESGFCGVQTHFNAIAAYARERGFPVIIAEPHQVSRWVRRVPGLVGRLLKHLSAEYAVLWNRHFAAIFLRWRLLQEVRRLKGQPLVVYAQDPLSARAALRLRRRPGEFRLVAVMHFNVSEAYENVLNRITREGGMLWRTLMSLERQTLKDIDSIIFVSDYMRRLVVERNPGLAGKDLRVINNFPRFSSAPVKVGDGIGGDLISIGTLEPRKNQGYLLRILAEAKRLGYFYRLTLVGDGPSRIQWEGLAHSLGIADQVRFLGYRANASELLTSHRAYAHAAQMENMPLTLIEAMAKRLPVFAPAVGGIPEIFGHGAEGMIWPLDDVSKCAWMLIGLLEDEPSRIAMGLAAEARYERAFSAEVLGPRWLSAITGETFAQTMISAVKPSALAWEGKQ